jgi:hypothetical protein
MFCTEIIYQSKFYPMKKLLFVLSVMVLVSCGQHKKEIARMQAKQDSIAQLGVQKDNSILEFVSAMNEIQMNMDSVKTIQKIVSVQTAPGTELKAEAKKRIIEDIRQINELLQKNKDLVKSMQGKLNSSNVKIKELQNMVELLNKQMIEKDGELARLNTELENLHVNVTGLNQKIETITKESEQTIKEKNDVIDTKTTELNTAYYAFGTKKELEAKNVIEKEGGVLGMGKTLKLKKDFNREFFMKIDIRQFSSLPLNTKKAKLVTYHPAGSYHMVMTAKKTVESIVIDNSEEFWKASKYMLIVVE